MEKTFVGWCFIEISRDFIHNRWRNFKVCHSTYKYHFNTIITERVLSALERAPICHAAPGELCLWLVTVGFDDLIVEQPEGLLVLGQLTESVDQNVIAKGIDRDWKLVS